MLRDEGVNVRSHEKVTGHAHDRTKGNPPR
jgi:hypothetical protein